MDNKRSFLKNPTLKDLIWMSAAWLTGTFLITAAATDLFQEPLTFSNAGGFGILVLSSTTISLIMIRNYLTNRKAGKQGIAKSNQND